MVSPLEKFTDPSFWVELAAMGVLTYVANVIRKGVSDVRAFLVDTTEDLSHIRKVADETYRIHVEPSSESLFQIGKFLEVLQDTNKTASRILSYLTACFRLLLLLASKQQVDSDQVSQIQQDLSREL